MRMVAEVWEGQGADGPAYSERRALDLTEAVSKNEAIWKPENLRSQ